MRRIDIKCEICKRILGFVDAKDDSTDEQIAQSIEGYSCEECSEHMEGGVQ